MGNLTAIAFYQQRLSIVDTQFVVITNSTEDVFSNNHQRQCK